MGLLDRLSGVQDVARVTISFREGGNHRLVVERGQAVPANLQGPALDAALFLYYAAKSLHALGAGPAADELRQYIALSGVVLRRDMFEPFKSYIDAPGECIGRLQMNRSGELSINTTFRVPLADTNNYVLDSVLLLLSRAAESQTTPEPRNRLADAIEALGAYYQTAADPSSLQALRHAAAAAFGTYQASHKIAG